MDMGLSDEVRSLLHLANQEAVRRMNDEITSIHLLLVLSRRDTGGASAILHHLLDRVDQLRMDASDAVDKLPVFPDEPWISGIWPKSPGWKNAMDVAVGAATAAGKKDVWSEHLLVGLTVCNEEPTMHLLHSRGLTHATVVDHFWVIEDDILEREQLG